MIFVGGTGRSGTTLLAEIIGQHPLVWNVPTETRFLVDPGGVRDLVPALSTTYTPFHGSDALTRFRNLLTRDVAGCSAPGVPSQVDLTVIFGRDHYADWAERFLAALTWYTFDDRSTQRTVGRYFADRNGLVALCRSGDAVPLGAVSRRQIRPHRPPSGPGGGIPSVDAVGAG
jgi:hypothetical protein